MYVPTDLHGHTFCSDGRASPAQFVAFRKLMGFKVISVSDHDVFTAVREVDRLARDAGMIVVPAAEVTSVLHCGTPAAEQIHVLAYFPPSILEGGFEETFLYRRGLRLQERWREFVLDWVENAGDDGSKRRLREKAGLERFGAAAFPGLQMMIEVVSALAPALSEEFRRHHVRFWEDRELFAWTPEELCDAIRADGAVDVVAHAVRYKDKERLAKILDYASGVEVYTSRHNPRVAARFRAYAEENDKLWTASADDHQNREYVKPPCGTPVATMERIFGAAVPESLIAEAA